MSSHERGRSPSAGQASTLRSAASASPHTSLDAPFTGPINTLAPNHYNGLGAQTSPGAYHDPTTTAITQDNQQQPGYFLGPTYTDFQELQQKLQQPPVIPSQNSNVASHAFLQSQGFAGQGNTSGFNYNQGGQGSNHVSPGALSQANSPAGTNNDSSAFPSFDFNQTDFDQQTNSVDPSLLSDLDPNSIDLLPQQQSVENTGGSLDPMATTMQSHSPTPPHLLPDMAHHQSNSPSPHASPSSAHSAQANFGGFNRPRNTSETLDPSSAMYPQGQNEWTNMGAYRGHRRTPSDNYSDYSSHSNQASPYMPTVDSFDNAHSSPLLNPTQDPAFNDGLGLQHFNLNENQQPQQQQQQQQQGYPSPGHSPHISPRLMPQQQALPHFTPDNNYGLNSGMNGQYVQQQNGLEMFPGTAQEPFPSLNQQNSDLGLADQMSPPEINIDYAPPSRPMDSMRPSNDGEALSPPMRSESHLSHFQFITDEVLTV